MLLYAQGGNVFAHLEIFFLYQWRGDQKRLFFIPSKKAVFYSPMDIEELPSVDKNADISVFSRSNVEVRVCLRTS